MEPCKGSKYQRFDIKCLNNRGLITIDLNGPDSHGKATETDFRLAHIPKIKNNSVVALVRKTAENKLNNEQFKLVKVMDSSFISGNTSRLTMNPNDPIQEDDCDKRVSVVIHSASDPDYVMYVHKKRNYMLENQYEVRMKKWSEVLKSKTTKLSKCYFNLWADDYDRIFGGTAMYKVTGAHK